MSNIQLAIIGGSGLYNMPSLKDVTEINVDTPFGAPSAPIVTGTLHGRNLAFLPRHGRGHTLNPSEVPYAANIYALKTLGVSYIISVSACGSLRDDLAPGHIVVPDQLFDHTKGLRRLSFFDGGLAAHVSPAAPFSPELSQALATAVSQTDGTLHEGGTFITIEGPRFSTKGESHTFRRWGMDIIGMTTSPEAFLALEAEIAYAVMAHITDYDVWHESEEPVTVEAVIRVLQHDTKIAQDAITHLVATMDDWATGDFAAHSALKDALITDRDHITAEARQRLQPLIARYFD